jgi:release factor glutamine methyltransferase
MTVTEAVQEGARKLRDSSVDEDRRTAALLLGQVLGLDRAQLLIRSNQIVTDSQLGDYLRLVERRAAGEPLQYITGLQEFYGLEFVVTPDVLIPRPETEFVVGRILTLAKGTRSARPVIVDVGTGSGCISIALARHISDLRVIAIDVSAKALNIARANAERHGVAARIEFIEGDMFEALSGRNLEGLIDFVASNPPYLPTIDRGSLQREVRDWEPSVALFAGREGLDFYKRLFDEARPFVRQGGCLVCEIGYGQLEAIRHTIDSAHWEYVDVTSDLQGIPRVVTVRRNP